MRQSWIAWLMFLGLLGAGCSSTLGADCRRDSECSPGRFCCFETRCGGGMCTRSCVSDRDCPSNGYCSGSICFLPCASDRDCPTHLECRSKEGKLMCRGD